MWLFVVVAIAEDLNPLLNSWVFGPFYLWRTHAILWFRTGMTLQTLSLTALIVQRPT